MARLAIIGGSGFGTLPGLDEAGHRDAETRFGTASAPLVAGRLQGHEILFLTRHGAGHRVPPHRINYRANVQALVDAGASSIIGLGAVGGITPELAPGVICVPDQLIDYTHGRAHTLYDGEETGVHHVDFTHPYSEALRRQLLEAGAAAGIALRDGGTYAVTQGPRLETAAEIRRLQRDGCDVVGMTAMPEVALARELGVEYCTLAFVVNWAAGLSDEPITMDAINAQSDRCAAEISRLLAVFAERRHAGRSTSK